MRFLADENFPGTAVTALIAARRRAISHAYAKSWRYRIAAQQHGHVA